MKKGLSLFLSLLLVISVITSIPVSVFAADTTETSANIVEFFSIDKTLMSEGETATITIKVAEGYTAKWFYFYKPITNNTETVYLYLASDNTYTGTFKVDAQTESGVWKVKSITLKDAADKYTYLYNSDNYTGTSYTTTDFSSLDFEVVGTNADVTKPVIDSYSINKNTASEGENITFTTKVIDEHLPSSFYLWYKNPSNESEAISMKKIDDTGLYQGILTIDSETEIGLWRPYYFSVSDTNDNSVTLYNSNVSSYGSNKADLSSLNFEVVDVNNSTENDESFIVVFKDGYGNTLSTQKVAKGESAVEPEPPTNELYLFNGWDTEFTNITSDKVITATWILNPNVTYDREIHVGKTFNIEVYSTASQNYTITCSEDIDFETSLYGTSYTITNGNAYYGKEYKITVNDSGSFIFYVKGSKASNTLTYKVKVSPHNFETEWTIDKEASCTTTGSKSHHCSICDVKNDTETIPALGHNFSNEWTIDVASTCTEEGSKSHHCLRCNTKTDVTVIEALGHNYSDEWTIDKFATCTEEGSKSHHCTVCDAKADITAISSLGHNLSDWLINAEATVYKAGTEYKECPECGEVLETAEIPQLKCSKPTLKTISNTQYGVKITWGKVKGADKYYVYRKVKGGSYSRIGSTTKTYYTDKTAKSGKKYYYIVKAINEAGASSSSSALSKLYLADPTLKTPTSTKSGVSLKWTKTAGAEGYIIYRKTGSGSYTKLKTEKGVSNLSYVDKSAKKGKKYTYKVKAYYSKTYSAYSNTKTITDKY